MDKNKMPEEETMFPDVDYEPLSLSDCIEYTRNAAFVYDPQGKLKPAEKSYEITEVMKAAKKYAALTPKAEQQPRAQKIHDACEKAETAIALLIGDLVYMADRMNEGNRFRDTVNLGKDAIDALEAIKDDFPALLKSGAVREG